MYGIANISFENNTNKSINLKNIQIIANYLNINDIELILTDNLQIKEINFNTRGINNPTDVLSFPYENMPNVPLGSIVISTDFVEKCSLKYDHSYEEEFTLLFIHGALHLLGYDHENDCGEHRKKEEELIKKFNLPKSLIVRVLEEV